MVVVPRRRLDSSPQRASTTVNPLLNEDRLLLDELRYHPLSPTAINPYLRSVHRRSGSARCCLRPTCCLLDSPAYLRRDPPPPSSILDPPVTASHSSLSSGSAAPSAAQDLLVPPGSARVPPLDSFAAALIHPCQALARPPS